MSKTDEQLKKEASDQAKLDRVFQRNVDDTVRALFMHPNGRDFVWWLLGLGAIGTQPFARDPAQTAFNCGELNVGNQILARITEIAPDGYIQLLKEKQNGRTSGDSGASDNFPGSDTAGDDGTQFGSFDLEYPDRERDPAPSN